MNNKDITILVVDDNELNVDLLSRRLDRDGFSVQTAIDGREALKKMADNPPDLVLLDIMMPIMDGLDVLGEMQEHEGMEQIPVVMVTAKNDPESVNRCLEWGAVDYIVKPINMVKLRACIQSILS